MKRLIGAAVAACAIGMPGAAAADVVVFQQSGTTTDLSMGAINLPGVGDYRFSFTTSVAANAHFEVIYTSHWDTFVAPAPRPHDEFITGNTGDVYDGVDLAGIDGSWTYTIPETTYTYFNSVGFEWASVPDGTLLYEEVKSERPHFYFYAFADELGTVPFDYTVTVTRLSAVPEPATWAMMIIGFGAAGSLLRGSRRKASAALA